MEYVNDSKCGLSEAIVAVNNQAAFDGCPKGTGSDVITVPSGTYTAAADVFLNIYRSVTIKGGPLSTVNTRPTTVINAANVTAADGTLLYADDTVNAKAITVTLQNLELEGANNAAGITGIWTYGTHGSTANVQSCFINDFTYSGIYDQGFSLGVTNTYLGNNTTSDSGGGIYFDVQKFDGDECNLRLQLGSQLRRGHRIRRRWDFGGDWRQLRGE